MTAKQAIIVSGGSRGLGAGLVERLLSAGHQVATCGRSESDLIHRWREDPQCGDRFWFRRLDLAEADLLPEFVAEVRERFGRVDALINNAAVAHDGVLALELPERIEQMLQVNLRAAILLSRECARQMLLQRGGSSIINISSIIASRGFSGLAVYAATKAALEGMTRALARELGPRQIRVNAVAPGYLETEMSHALSDQQRQQIVRRTPLGRLGTVDDVIPCVEFLLGPGAAYITGQVITIDGGSTV